MHILVSDHLHGSGWEDLRAAPDVTTAGPFETRAEVLAASAEADAIIVRSATTVDAELLNAAPRLKVVARAGARLNNVDIDEATRRGIMVINVPAANVIASAEHTFAMLLALARELPEGYNAVRAGDWPRHQMLGFQLYGKVLGIIGFGGLGRAVAARARAFGMHMLAYDPYINLSFAREQEVEIVNFTELLARADIVSLHIAHTPQTHHILNLAAFAQMKPGAVLVNCTHSGLVDEVALLGALENGTLAKAALDTFSQEPPPPDHPLIHHPRVIVAPHLNQNTIESQTVTSRQVVADVLSALCGDDYRHVVNLPFNQNAPYQTVKSYVHLASKLGGLQGQLAEGRITRVELELLGEGLRDLVRPVAAALLSGMLLPAEGRLVNWTSAPMLAHEQGIITAQVQGLVQLEDFPNLIACRVYWEGDLRPSTPFRQSPGERSGHRTVAGVLFANGEARLVQYDHFHVDAYPEGYVLILENDDVPGVIGKVGTRMGQAGINIGQWRYGREAPGKRAISFINLDSHAPQSILTELENEPEIHRARLVRL